MVEDLRAAAREHLLLHFTRKAAWQSPELPMVVRGEGVYVYDDRGRRFLDGLSGLFCVNMGHGRADIVAAATKQMETLAYTTNWSVAHPASVEAARLIAGLAPGDLDAVFFVNSGSEAVESALKFSWQYHRNTGHPERRKVIARHMAYHGTTVGALSITGVPAYRAPFEPLLPEVFHVRNTYGAEVSPGTPVSSLPCVQDIRDIIEREEAETIAAIFAEPVQNGRGALVPPDGYWAELRSICDENGILLVADEVINGFGRLGHWFGIEREGIVPDLITFAKGATSGYVPLGGLIARRSLVEGLMNRDDALFTHGATWGGHPVATAASVANIKAMQDEGVLGNVLTLAPELRAGLEDLAARHSVVREVRGTGFFYAIELMADRDSGAELTGDESIALLREVLPRAMREAGLLTRPDDRGATMLVLAPPLIADRAVIAELLEKVDAVISAAEAYVKAQRA